MDLEARKITFVQKFLKLQSEETISKLEKLLRKEKKYSSNHRKVQQMSAEKLNKRIDKSMEDSKNDRLTEVNDLIAEIEKWS